MSAQPVELYQPLDAASEEALIGEIFRDPSCLPDVRAVVTASDFFRYGSTYRAMLKLSDDAQTVDAIAVSELLQSDKAAPDLAKLCDLTTQTICSDPVARARAVRKKSVERQTWILLNKAVGEVRLGNAGVISNLQVDLEQINTPKGGAMSGIEIAEKAEAAMERATQGMLGLSSGLPALDRALGGFVAGRYYIVAARPSIGKTALTNQIALHMTRSGHAVGVCSLEMTADELGIRSVAHVGQVDLASLMYGVNRTKEYEKDSSDALGVIACLPLFTNTESLGLDEIIAQCTSWVRKERIEAVVVDHVGLIEHKANSANERLTEISRALKKMAKRLNIAVIAVSQLNRNVEKEKRRPALSDLRDSGSLEQDCDAALFIHTDNDSLSPVSIKLGTLKNRQGRRGWLGAEFLFHGDTQTFKEVAR